MKHQRSKSMLLLLTLLVLTLSLVGCSDDKPEKSAETSTVVKVADMEVIVGVTKLSDLQEKGFSLFYDQLLSEPVPADEVMPAKSYDIGIAISKDNVIYGTVQCLNDKEEEIPYVESIINEIDLNYVPNPQGSAPGFYTESVLVDDVDFKGMTPDQLQAAVKDTAEEEPTIIPFPDESVAFITFSRNNCYLEFAFDMETQVLESANIQMFHTKF